MTAAHEISHLVDQVYEAPLQADGWNSLVPLLEERLGGGVAIFARGQDSLRFVAGCTNCTPALKAAYENNLWREDRAMEKFRSAPPGEIILDNQIVSLRQRLRSPFYNDFLGAIGSDRGIYASFHRTGGEVFVLSVQRPSALGDYDNDEVGLVRALSPHLQRSFRIWEHLRRAKAERLAAMKALDHASLGIIITDARYTVRFANDAAEQILRAGPLRLDRERLVASSAYETQRLRRAIALAARDERSAADTVLLSSTDRALTVLVAPTASVDPEHVGEPLATLLFSAGERPIVEEGRVPNLYQLTPAETRLLSALVAGERLPEYARRTGISLTTAKFHLSSLFDKTGERRQADLIRLALADPSLRLKVQSRRS